MTRAYRARYVLSPDQTPLEHGIVELESERIQRVGVRQPDTGTLIDLGEVALLPGLVNSHTHLEFSSLTATCGTPGQPLPEWIRTVIEHRQRRVGDGGAAIRAGLAESFAAGVTTVVDMATEPREAYPLDVDHAAFPRWQLFHEVIGFSRARAASVAAETARRVAASPAIPDSRPCPAAREIGPAGICPHAPYTVGFALLEKLVELAVDEQRPMAMHLAESTQELQLLTERRGPFRDLLQQRSMWDDQAIPPRARPLDYLKLLSHAPRTLIVHGNYLTNEELVFLGQNRDRMSLVYCPRTHAYFGHAPYPLARAVVCGVRVVVGTDSRASNPDLAVWEELRSVRRHHRTIEPNAILAMATRASAEALGFTDRGRLAAGYLADMIAVRLPDHRTTDPLKDLLEHPLDVAAVWIGGELVTSSSVPR